MATFTVKSKAGTRQITADRCEADGSWLVFKTRGHSDLRISEDGVQSVTGSDPPGELARSLRWAGVVVLTAMALFCLAVGLVDVVSAEFQSGRVLGGLVLLASPLCAMGAWGLLVRDASGRERALLGALSAAAVSVVIILVWFSGAGRQLWPPLLLGLVVLVTTAVGVALLKVGVRPRIPVAVTGIAAAGLLITAFQFWYEKDYVPASMEAGLTQRVELTSGPVAADGTSPAYATAKVTLKNSSGTKVRMIGSHYNVWTFTPGTDDRVFVTSGRLNYGTGSWFAPDQEDTQQFVVPLPDRSLPALHFDLSVYVTKGDRLLHGQCLDRGVEPSCSRAFSADPVRWEIGEGSLINSLVREPRYLVVDRDWEEAGPYLTRLEPCISRDRTCPDDFDVKLNAVYGVVRIGAGAELLLDGASAPPADVSAGSTP
jgi:hypothetical protein